MSGIAKGVEYQDIGNAWLETSARVSGVSKARLIITFVVIEGRTHAEVACEYGFPPAG
jgi:hypothetical protein